MYSYEIDDMMKRSNYLITRKDYLSLSPTTSPQLARIKYDPFKDSFEIWTDDGYHWEFKVKEE